MHDKSPETDEGIEQTTLHAQCYRLRHDDHRKLQSSRRHSKSIRQEQL